MSPEFDPVEETTRLRFHFECGFTLPSDGACQVCLGQLHNYFSLLQTLEELLDEGAHECSQVLMSVMVLHATLNGSLELIGAISEDIAANGWHIPTRFSAWNDDEPVY